MATPSGAAPSTLRYLFDNPKDSSSYSSSSSSSSYSSTNMQMEEASSAGIEKSLINVKSSLETLSKILAEPKHGRDSNFMDVQELVKSLNSYLVSIPFPEKKRREDCKLREAQEHLKSLQSCLSGFGSDSFVPRRSLCAMKFQPLSEHESAITRLFEKIKSDRNTSFLFLDDFLRSMPKVELHTHLTGAIYSETYLDFASKKGLFFDPEKVLFHKENASGRISADELKNYPDLQHKFRELTSMRYNKDPDKGMAYFFRACEITESVARYMSWGDLLFNILQHAVNQNICYKEIMVDFPIKPLPSGFEKEYASYAEPLQKESMRSLNAALGERWLLDYAEEHSRELAKCGVEVARKLNFPSITSFPEIFLSSERTPSPERTSSPERTPSPERAPSPERTPSPERMPSPERTSSPERKSSLETGSLKGEGIQVRYLVEVMRTIPNDKFFASIAAAMSLINHDPSVVGINIVGPENDMNSRQNFSTQMQILNFFCENNPRANITLHAGELTEDYSAPGSRLNRIKDSINIGRAKRIGHAIAFDSDTVALMREKNIAVEICLSSNDYMFGVKDEKHPIAYYIKNNIPVTINTDDEGINCSDLTKEFKRAVNSYKFSYLQLKQFVRNGIQHSFLPGESIFTDRRLYSLKSEFRDIAHLKGVLPESLSPKVKMQIKLEREFAKFEKTMLKKSWSPDLLSHHSCKKQSSQLK